MDGLWIAMIFIAVPVVAIWGILWRLRRSTGILQKWAAREGYELLQVRRRFLRRGAFWWRTSDLQDVFRVLVRDSTGRERGGFVRVGGWFWGMWSDAARVEWDDER